jgi:hypothetical protein
MVFLVFVFAIGLGFLALALVRLTSPDESDEGGGDDGPPGRGGRGPRPKPRGPEPPTWWPEFEREFRAYVQQQDLRVPVSTGGGGS